MSKLNLEDVLFICLGIADAEKSRFDAADNWRDAVVLTEADVEGMGGKGPTWVTLEAAEDEVCRLASSLRGANEVGWPG